MPEKEKYFIFMDESGNNTQDRYFVLGILMVPVQDIAPLFNFLERISSKIQTRSYDAMTKRIDAEITAGNIDRIVTTAKSFRSFEMKFKTIHKENEDLYIHIIRKYATFPRVRFCALVFDKQDPAVSFHPDGMSHWERYLNNAAMLITSNIQNNPQAEYVVLADQITQPEGGDDYETTLVNKIRARLVRKSLPESAIWGATRIESHSSTFLQLVDILVGAVGYDFVGVDKERKQRFVEVLHETYGFTEKFGTSVTKNSPNYFSVWKFQPPR